MDNYKLLKKEKMLCPICGEEHEIELRESNATMTIKEEKITYKEKYYFCSNSIENNCFTKDNMIFENLLTAKDTYRKEKNLLTSKEIKEIRNKFKLTQAEFSILLGLGEITITRYETKQIQDVSIDQIIKFVNSNPITLLEYLEERKDKFTNERYNEIKNNIKNIIKEDEAKINILKIKYIEYDKENEDNGNRLLNIDKLSNYLAYIAKSMKDKGKDLKKVVLMKLLWYIDSISYKKNNKAITGLVYVHEKYGALPIGHDEIMYLPSISFDKQQPKEDQYQYNIYPKENYKIKKIDDKEREIIDKVISKFKDYKSSEISNYMHEEDAYKQTAPEQIIPFSLTKTLKDF